MGTLIVDADAEPRHASASDRRMYGYVLVAVALIAALCVPGLVGRRAEGSAMPAPPAPPPTAGQCVAQIDRPEDLQRLTSLPTVPCDTPHSAEIVFVGQFSPADSYPQEPTSPALLAPNQLCTQQVAQFLGDPDDNLSDADLAASIDAESSTAAAVLVGDGEAAVPHVRPQAAAVVTVPTRHQWNTGQRWFSCRVQPADDTLPMSYTGSVRLAAQGPLPAAFGRCAQVIGGDAVPCAEPHYAERLTDLVSSDGALNCRRLAQQLIGTHDPTFGAALSNTSWQESGGRSACWATSTSGQAFVGTLIDWGDRPLPTP